MLWQDADAAYVAGTWGNGIHGDALTALNSYMGANNFYRTAFAKNVSRPAFTNLARTAILVLSLVSVMSRGGATVILTMRTGSLSALSPGQTLIINTNSVTVQTITGGGTGVTFTPALSVGTYLPGGNGDLAGSLNAGWSRSPLSETSSTWTAQISNSLGTTTVDITPRNQQLFLPTVGSQVSWTTGTQSSTVTVDSTGAATAAGVLIPAGISTTITFTEVGGGGGGGGSSAFSTLMAGGIYLIGGVLIL